MIRIKPISHHVSDQFRALEAKQRDCRFSYEVDSNSSMFKEYKQLGCLFECRLKFAIINARCIPWDYPMPPGVEHKYLETCFSNKNGSAISNLAQFHKLMDSKESMADCDCIQDCEHVTYEPQVYLYLFFT